MIKEVTAGLIILFIGLIICINPELGFLFKGNRILRHTRGYIALMRVISGAFMGIGILLIIGIIQ